MTVFSAPLLFSSAVHSFSSKQRLWSLLPNEPQTPTQSGALSTATVPSSGWLGRCGAGASECAEEIGRPDRAQGWKGSIVCVAEPRMQTVVLVMHQSAGSVFLASHVPSRPAALTLLVKRANVQTWEWGLVDCDCVRPGVMMWRVCLDLINLQLEQHGKRLVAAEVQSETEWHKRAEISQGWNGKRRRGPHWLDYSAKHRRRDWVRKWLRDLSLIVFFQKGTSQSLKSVTTLSYHPFYCIKIDRFFSSLSPSVRVCLKWLSKANNGQIRRKPLFWQHSIFPH